MVCPLFFLFLPWSISNGDKLTYAWTLTCKPSGSSAALASPAIAQASLPSLLDTLYAHRYLSDLGLGSGHTVSRFIKPAPVPASATAVSFSIIGQGISSVPYGAAITTSVARSSSDWAALWQTHKGSTNTSALPPVDFSKKTVLALFYPQLGSCMATSITRVYQLNGKLVVEYASRSAAPDTACTSIAYSAAELVTIELAPDPNLPIVFQKTN